MFDRGPTWAREILWAGKHRAVRWLAERGFVESLHVLLQDQLRFMNIAYVIDVGANRGQYGRLLRRLGFKGRIISFEPIEESFAELSRVAGRDPNWEVHQLALGDVDGQLTMNVMSDDVFSSFFEVNAAGRQLFPAESRLARSETVSVRRLEGLLPDLVPRSLLWRTHLKCDTQGADNLVINGLGGLITEIPSLQVEISLISIYESQLGYQAVLGQLHERGYRLTAFSPVARDGSLCIVEADALLRRPS